MSDLYYMDLNVTEACKQFRMIAQKLRDANQIINITEEQGHTYYYEQAEEWEKRAEILQHLIKREAVENA